MNYRNNKALQAYKSYLLHTLLAFVCITVTLGLISLFLRIMRWMY
ncbi:MAG: hypothetical protein Unbinned3338contig1000_30 [Prokaryotic dsDNA virus sp.]|nr:MAG: hypothetical protein Unbinned3338contig1000_30 [Prokaryotic dsDNA virus sp.]